MSASQVVQVHVPGGMALEDRDRFSLLFVAACPGPEQKAASRELLLDLPRSASADQAHQPDAAGPGDATGHGRGGKDGNQATPIGDNGTDRDQAPHVGEAGGQGSLALGELVPIEPTTQRDDRLVLELPDIADRASELLSAALQLRIRLICARSKPASSSSSMAAMRST